MGIRCFLIEPILGIEIPYEPREWPPYRTILGWLRPDTGEEHTHKKDFGVGAMWRATWIPRNWDWTNETEPHIYVCCPNGEDGTRDWDIDSRAANCTMPHDKKHRCWIRHGVPPNLTVDKQGLTCAAGAGSIAMPKWHGFLRNGELVP